MIVIALSLLLVPICLGMAVVAGIKALLRWRAGTRMAREQRRLERETYLDSLSFPSFYQLVIIFTVASIGGLLLETLWVRFAMGIWQHRYGMVWGPFSPLYGVGAVLLSVFLWKLRKRPVWVIFLVSMLLGSLLEQATGMLIDSVLHATSWSYTHLPDAITKYVSLRMSIIWGLLGWVWCRACLPEAVWLIGEPKRRGELVLVSVLTAFLVLDGVMTAAVTMRKASRDAGLAPANAIERYIDKHYDDHFMDARFENLEFDGVQKQELPKDAYER
ncbi:MAG: putative ABC transporter permease [Coriobacteriia bacterium]|nr:putative ABC transporter permease [Coriobacteriia bacterium]MBS5478238.1 putative ABC transporter permease [Coriobacteriia bacterium]